MQFSQGFQRLTFHKQNVKFFIKKLERSLESSSAFIGTLLALRALTYLIVDIYTCTCEYNLSVDKRPRGSPLYAVAMLISRSCTINEHVNEHPTELK